MAIITTRTCDFVITPKRGEPRVCGEPVEEPTSLRLDNDTRESDLCPLHREELVAALDPFITVGRKVTVQAPTQGVRRSVVKATAEKRKDLSDIRAWAAEHDMKVSPRGRIAQDVLQAYDAAHAA